MKRNILILLTLITLSITGMAEDNDQYHTEGVLNGRAWVTWSEPTKLSYIAGYSDCFASVHLLILDLQSMKQWDHQEVLVKMPKMNFGNLSDALDAFYRTRENVNIAIGDAISVIALRTEGMAETKIQVTIEGLRKHANAAK